MKSPFIETVLRKTIYFLVKILWKRIVKRGLKQRYKKLIDVPYSDPLEDIPLTPVIQHTVARRGWFMHSPASDRKAG